MSEKTIIEVNGVKLEVDLRHARRIEEIRVGDRVKVLTKNYSGHQVSPGVVIGFEPFPTLPTIVVAYVEKDYSTVAVKFLHFNANTKEIEVIKAIDDDTMDIDREGIIKVLDRQIATHQRDIAAIEERKEYFLREFRAYWTRVEKPAVDTVS